MTRPIPTEVDQAWSEGLYQAVRARHEADDCVCPELVANLLKTTQHPALCPQCGSPAASEVVWNFGLVTEAHYLCANDREHAWTTKWADAS